MRTPAIPQRLTAPLFDSTYGMAISSVYDQGNVFAVDVLDVSEDVLINRFLSGVKAIATISLALNYPTLASVTHSLVNSYKNLLAVSVSTDYTFEAAQKVKDYLENPEAFASAAPVAAAEESAPAAAAEAPKEEEKEGECKVYINASLCAPLMSFPMLQSPTTIWASVSSTKRFARQARPGWEDADIVARDEMLYGALLESLRSTPAMSSLASIILHLSTAPSCTSTYFERD